jgi:hypothetical protein
MTEVFRGYVPHERDGLVYVRKRGRVGMQVEDDAVSIPGYVLEGDGLLAQPGVEGGIETVVPANMRLRSGVLPLGPGVWQVSVVPPNPDIDFGLYVGKQRPTRVLTVTEESGPVRLRVTSHAISSLLGTIRIERVASDSVENPRPTLVEPTIYTTEPFGTFEHGLGDWHEEGRAFNHPSSGPTKRQTPITGNVGKFLNSSGRKNGDRVKGQLTSEPFTVTAGMVLSFRVGGGKHPRVGVRLMEGDRTMMVWHGDDSEDLEQVQFALTPYAGRQLHVEVFDDWGGGWGHVLADEFALLRPTADEPDVEQAR